jgi:hypothetical protein
VVSVVQDESVEDVVESTEPVVALWAPGSAVLTTGIDSFGQAGLAVWQVSPDGHPTGSWVVTEEQAYSDPAVARQLLITFERRALAASGDGAVNGIVSRLTTTAGIDAGEWWTGQTFSPVGVFDDVLARRGELTATVAAVRQSGRTVASLSWDRTFSPDDRPTTVTQLAELAKIASPAAAPVVAEALRLSRLLRWLVELWTKTEQVKNRRDYLRDKHGDPEALPPGWMGAVQTASATRLPL